MLNINELEQRWIRYKIKSYIPYIIIVLSLIFIATSLYFFLSSTTKNKQVAIPKKKIIQKQIITTIQKENDRPQEIPTTHISKQKKVQQVVIDQKNKISTQNNPTKESEQNQGTSTLMEPSMKFLEHFNDSYSPHANKEVVPKKIKRTKITPIELPKEEYVTAQKKDIIIKKETKAVLQERPKKEKVAIIINRRESQNDIKEVISRFQKNNNPALSLFAAKKYYELGNYKQAYNYALVTNKINNDIEESWIIFAKSLVKLGKKDQAIKILRQYINYSHSSNAQTLLDEIQRGKFR